MPTLPTPTTLKAEIRQLVAREQRRDLRRQSAHHAGEDRSNVHVNGGGFLFRHMIDQRRIVLYPPVAGRGVARDMRKIGVLFAVGMFLRGGEPKLFGEAVAEQFVAFMRQIYPRMPSLKRRKTGKFGHAIAIGQRHALGDAPRRLVAVAGRQRRHRETGGEPLEIGGEIDIGQRLVEIIDVE